MKVFRTGALVAFLIAAQAAFPSFHEVQVSEILTGANGHTGIQYVELEMEGPAENFFTGHHLVSRNASGTQIGDFACTHDVTPGLLGKVLFATQAFADLNVVTPDFIVPANFLSPTGGQVSWVDSVL